MRHIYFVAETKGTMSTMKLREVEKTKIECARKYFDEISKRITADHVKYDVVTDYGKLWTWSGARRDEATLDQHLPSRRRSERH